MDYSKTPHVCFSAEFSPRSAASVELPLLLQRGLESNAVALRVIKAKFVAPWAAVLRVGAQDCSIVLGKSRFADDEWILIVSPPGAATIFERLMKRQPRPDVDGLKLSCRTIHAVLVAIPNVSRIRWYFEGFSSQSGAVGLPDQLPW